MITSCNGIVLFQLAKIEPCNAKKVKSVCVPTIKNLLQFNKYPCFNIKKVYKYINFYSNIFGLNDICFTWDQLCKINSMGFTFKH